MQLCIFRRGNFIHKSSHQKNHICYYQTNLHWQSHQNYLQMECLLTFRKNTDTGLYNHFSISFPQTHWTAWIKSSTFSASRKCFPNKLSSKINFIKKLASRNSFSRPVVKSAIYQVLNTTEQSTENAESPEVLTIYVCMPYYSDKGLSLLKSSLRKFWSNCVKTCPIRFKAQYDVNKTEFYCNTKIKQLRLWFLLSWLWYQLHSQNRKKVVWKNNWTCLVWKKKQKKQWCLQTSQRQHRVLEHLFDIACLHSPLFTSPSPIQNSDKFDLRTARINLVQDNTEITDKHKNWNILLFKGALKIKRIKSNFEPWIESL